MNTKHKDLQDVAIGRLYEFGCSIFAKEVPTENGIADALGIKTLHGRNAVYYIECKASRSDLICAKQKAIYKTAIGDFTARCYLHSYGDGKGGLMRPDNTGCPACEEMEAARGDTGIDFYYLIVADGVKVEDTLYPAFGVINEKGIIVRKAKKMKRDEAKVQKLIVAVAHVLVYKAYGKIYEGERL